MAEDFFIRAIIKISRWQPPYLWTLTGYPTPGKVVLPTFLHQNEHKKMNEHLLRSLRPHSFTFLCNREKSVKGVVTTLHPLGGLF